MEEGRGEGDRDGGCDGSVEEGGVGDEEEVGWLNLRGENDREGLWLWYSLFAFTGVKAQRQVDTRLVGKMVGTHTGSCITGMATLLLRYLNVKERKYLPSNEGTDPKTPPSPSIFIHIKPLSHCPTLKCPSTPLEA